MGEIIDFIMVGSSIIDLKEIEKMEFGDQSHWNYDYESYYEVLEKAGASKELLDKFSS